MSRGEGEWISSRMVVTVASDRRTPMGTSPPGGIQNTDVVLRPWCLVQGPSMVLGPSWVRGPWSEAPGTKVDLGVEISMKNSRHTLMLAAAALILAVGSTTWLLSSPESVRRAGRAVVLLAGMVYGVQQLRRVRMTPSPVVLCSTVIVFGLLMLGKRMGPLFPVMLAVAVGLAWSGGLIQS